MTPFDPAQDRKPLTEEPKHDENNKVIAEEMMNAAEKEHPMDDYMEVRLVDRLWENTCIEVGNNACYSKFCFGIGMIFSHACLTILIYLIIVLKTHPKPNR